MATRIYKTPFAATGDKEVLATADQPDGKVSLQAGWTPDYGLPSDNANYRPVGRAEMNGILSEFTEGLGEIQLNGFAKWQAIDGGWPANAYVFHGGIVYRSLVDNNTESPGGGFFWAIAFDQAASTTTPGLIEIATQTEVNQGIDTVRAVVPATLLSLLNARAFGGKPKVTALQAAGTFTFTPTRPLVLIEQWGGGGGGGAGGNPSAGTGGGSGAYSRLWLIVNPGTAYTVINGAGGTGGSASGSTSNPGGAGGTSSFHGIVQSPGGGGGIGNGTGGGIGGAAGSGADFTLAGNSGGGPSVTTTGGGTQFGPPGGFSPFGCVGASSYTGIPANGRWGNGGHGGVGSTAGAQTSGGKGGDGVHLLTEY